VSQEWDEFNTQRLGGYLGKLELLARLQMEIDGERATAVREAKRLGAKNRDLADASGLPLSKVRAFK
jgi:hypothetical protein